MRRKISLWAAAVFGCTLGLLTLAAAADNNASECMQLWVAPPLCVTTCAYDAQNASCDGNGPGTDLCSQETYIQNCACQTPNQNQAQYNCVLDSAVQETVARHYSDNDGCWPDDPQLGHYACFCNDSNWKPWYTNGTIQQTMHRCYDTTDGETCPVDSAPPFGPQNGLACTQAR